VEHLHQPNAPAFHCCIEEVRARFQQTGLTLRQERNLIFRPFLHLGAELADARGSSMGFPPPPRFVHDEIVVDQRL
jgi:hypothetical protein